MRERHRHQAVGAGAQERLDLAARVASSSTTTSEFAGHGCSELSSFLIGTRCGDALLDCGCGGFAIWNGDGNVPARTMRSMCWRLKTIPLLVARSSRVSTRTGPVCV